MYGVFLVRAEGVSTRRLQLQAIPASEAIRYLWLACLLRFSRVVLLVVDIGVVL